MPFNIVLFEPEIPSNTGNIGRLCVGTNAILHLIKPMKFLITDKYVKRAGLDYWNDLRLEIHDSWNAFAKKYHDTNKYYFTKKSEKIYTNINFKKDDFLIFGPETRGLPQDLLKKNWDYAYSIPMSNKIRSINLSNSVAIVLYEGIRQVGSNSPQI
ncbi:MAG TPA: tRNA (cytidine(34)-2'-O)-methyltransferase [Candidatus Cloacimonetes bacterium]|nr:tRNA (cytidine(34)-2'-O)-methyltransferase [Candidatus Cloacimonadota bacterium]HEX37964.1 tRNA (cytidine(34)-2'-O)-methyltransferase [Candidatus Cloacimonadota bacterium]